MVHFLEPKISSDLLRHVRDTNKGNVSGWTIESAKVAVREPLGWKCFRLEKGRASSHQSESEA